MSLMKENIIFLVILTQSCHRPGQHVSYIVTESGSGKSHQRGKKKNLEKIKAVHPAKFLEETYQKILYSKSDVLRMMTMFFSEVRSF